MEILKRPNSIEISNNKKLSKIKSSHHNSFIKKHLKINPISPKFRSSSFNLFSSNDNNQDKNLSSINIIEKNNSSNKNNFCKTSKIYFIKGVETPNKEEKETNNGEEKKSLKINTKCQNYFKKNENNSLKFINNYPKTFYQKISNSIQKMKIKTDKTLEAMRKNMKISDKEVFHRMTSVINIHNIKNRKKSKNKDNNKENKEENSNNYDEYSNLNYSKIIKNKRNSNIFQVSIFSERFINRKEENVNSSINFSNYNFNHKKNNIKILGLSKIPNTTFSKIKSKPFYIPLFRHQEIKRKYYQNMYHCRSFEIKDKLIDKNIAKIYDIPSALIGLNSYEKEAEIQLKYIYNKIKLILDNIKHFKTNYMIKRDFRLSFINMENPVKAEFNNIIEELCVLLIKIIPQLLKSFYNSLDQLLFISIPEIDNEMKKKPSNEIECLKYNIIFFNKVSDYFSACIDIFNVIQKQIAEFNYTSNEFQPLNKNLDLARYDSTRLISMADSNIEKTKKDTNVLEKFEIGLDLKKKKIKEKDNSDIFERLHKRDKIKANIEGIKLDRINSALNLAANGMKKDIALDIERRKRIKINKSTTILNTVLIKDMMKYFKKNIKAKIISQQVIERFKTKELKRLKTIEDNQY